MKKTVLLAASSLFLCGSVLTYMASFRVFSNDRPNPNQNQFGGYGQLNSTNEIYYYDDTCFYYQARSAGMQFDESALFSYNITTGAVSKVCKRINCDHQTAACSIYPLYMDYHAIMKAALIDHRFYAPCYTSKKYEVIQWDPLSNIIEPVLEIPHSQTVGEQNGMHTELPSFFEYVMQLPEEQLLVQYNNVIHIYNHDLKEITHFACSDFTHPLVIGNLLYWIDFNVFAVNCYNLNTFVLEKDVLSDALEEREVCGITWGQPFVNFGYNGKLYFPNKDAVYAYDNETKSAQKVIKTDEFSEESNKRVCFGDGNRIYYKQEGIVYRMNLDNGQIEKLPEMTDVPAARVYDYLLVLAPVQKGEASDIQRYDLNGRKIE